MVDRNHEELPVIRQCQLLKISRSSYYYTPSSETGNLSLMKVLDDEYMKYPFYGSRQMKRHLGRIGYIVSRHRIRRLMRKMGLVAIYQRPKTSIREGSHKIYPYLLRDKVISKPNQVWCSDITYIPMKKGFMYLVAIKDWYSRRVLSWRLSNSMDSNFCVSALEEAIERYGRPEIFNSDQGSQFTSVDFTSVLENHHIEISMDGKGRWMDNVFIERLWRSLKYECVYLQEFNNGTEARRAIGSWIDYYNNRRPHSVFGGRTPNEVYSNGMINLAVKLAA